MRGLRWRDRTRLTSPPQLPLSYQMRPHGRAINGGREYSRLTARRGVNGRAVAAGACSLLSAWRLARWFQQLQFLLGRPVFRTARLGELEDGLELRFRLCGLALAGKYIRQNEVGRSKVRIKLQRPL